MEKMIHDHFVLFNKADIYQYSLQTALFLFGLLCFYHQHNINISVAAFSPTKKYVQQFK